MSIMFTQICINEEILPKYIYFKLHDPAAHKYIAQSAGAVEYTDCTTAEG